MTCSVQLPRQDDRGQVEQLAEKDGGQDGKLGLGADDGLDEGCWKTRSEQAAQDEALVVLQQVGSEERKNMTSVGFKHHFLPFR